jgi:hypothetical protein
MAHLSPQHMVENIFLQENVFAKQNKEIAFFACVVVYNNI